MKTVAIFALASLLSWAAAAQNAPKKSPPSAPATPAAPASTSGTGANLEAVLDRMDQTAKTFKTAEADFVWDQYERVVDSHDKQSGKIFFRRQGGELEMGAHITSPTEKFVVYGKDMVRLYEPRINQITEYSTGKNKAEFESFLVLGFGGRGHDLKNNFSVRGLGSEAVEGVPADKLELVPNTEKARKVFAKIYLWIDARGISVRQMFMASAEPGGNLRDAMYRNIKLNQNVSGDNFKLKTTGKPKIVRPQG